MVHRALADTARPAVTFIDLSGAKPLNPGTKLPVLAGPPFFRSGLGLIVPVVTNPRVSALVCAPSAASGAEFIHRASLMKLRAALDALRGAGDEP